MASSSSSYVGAPQAQAQAPVGARATIEYIQPGANDIADVQRTAAREHPFMIEASPEDMAKRRGKKNQLLSRGPSIPFLLDEWSWQYRTIDTDIGGARIGDVSAAFFISVNVTCALNTLPTPVLLSAPAALPGNVYYGKQRGWLWIPPCHEPMTWGPAGKQIHFVNPILYDPTFQHYGHISSEDIDDMSRESQTFSGKRTFSIDVDSLLGRTMKANEQSLGINLDRYVTSYDAHNPTARDDQDQVSPQFIYVIPAEIHEKIVRELKAVLSSLKKPQVNLKKAKIYVQPLGYEGSWENYVSSLNSKGGLDAAKRTRPGLVCFGLASRYRLKGT